MANKTYKQYLAERKPITNHLAPLTARPKYSRGDCPKDRVYLDGVRNSHRVLKTEIPVRKDGTIATTKYRKLIRGENVQN